MKSFSLFFAIVSFVSQPLLAQVEGPQGGTVPDQLIVKFRPGTPLANRETLFNSVNTVDSRRLNFIETAHVINLPGSTDLDAIIGLLERNPDVEFAERNARAVLSDFFPSDLDPEQWSLHNGTDIDIDAPGAWSIELGSSLVKVAVIDTGVDTDHWDLAANLLSGWNVIDNNSDVEETAANSHGTAIAGIIAAPMENGGIAGIAPETKILPVLFCDLTTRPARGCTDAHVADAIQFARNQAVALVNVSANFTDDIPLTKSQIQAAELEGILFIFSAGNSADATTPGTNIDSADSGNIYPCKDNLSNVICVAAVDKNGDKATFSHYGRRTVNLAAPGRDIFSTVNDGQHDEPGPNCCNFSPGDGTSFAAPHVTGVLALMKAQNPAYSLQQLKEFVVLSAQPTPTGDLEDKVTSEGMVNARTAVTAFGDSFDDASDLKRFFSDSPTNLRWAVAQNGSARCDPQVKTVLGSPDRVVEAKYKGRAGDAGSSWTLGNYNASYPPSNVAQSLVLRVTSSDGSDLVGEKGRTGIGFIEKESSQSKTCSLTSKSYTEVSFGGSSIAGIELDGNGNAEPFLFFSVPSLGFFHENTYPPFSVVGVEKLSIQIYYGVSSMTLRISDSVTGSDLFHQENIGYPTSWWPSSSAFKPAFIYFGVDSSDTLERRLYMRAFLSVR